MRRRCERNGRWELRTRTTLSHEVAEIMKSTKTVLFTTCFVSCKVFVFSVMKRR